MTTDTRLRWKLFALATLVGGVVFCTLNRPVRAAPCQSTVQYFYSDSACTDQVGERDVNCTGSTQTGQITCFRTTTYLECCGDCMPSANCVPYGTTYSCLQTC